MRDLLFASLSQLQGVVLGSMPLKAFLLDQLIKSSVILLVAWAAARFLRNASASARHQVWATALLAVLLLPALSLTLPAWRFP